MTRVTPLHSYSFLSFPLMKGERNRGRRKWERERENPDPISSPLISYPIFLPHPFTLPMNDSSSLSSDLSSSDLIYFLIFLPHLFLFFPIFLVSFPYLFSSSLRWSNLLLSSSHPGSKDGRHGNGSHHIWNGWTVYGICHCWSYEYDKGIFAPFLFLFLSPSFLLLYSSLFISVPLLKIFSIDFYSKTWPPFTPNHSWKSLKFPRNSLKIPWPYYVKH